MINLWLAFALICIAADWDALGKNRPEINYFTKPSALLFLMIWYWSTSAPGTLRLWFIIGFFFSLIGDAFLLIPVGYFRHGLAAFLLAHIAYALGLISGIKNWSAVFWLPVIILLVFFSLAIGKLIRVIQQNPRYNKMTISVVVYAVVISLMLIFASWTLFRPDWPKPASTLAALGALLFYFSDLTLAFDRFVNPLRNGRLLIRITYHLGQLSLAAGAILFGYLAV